MFRDLVQRLKKQKFEFVFCHRLPDRTPCIMLFGKPRKFLCYRCTGVLIGVIIPWVLLFFSPTFRNLVFVRSFLGIILSVIFFLPMLVDGFGQALEYWKSTNPRRFITGLGAGIAQTMMAMIVAGLIFRLIY